MFSTYTYVYKSYSLDRSFIMSESDKEFSPIEKVVLRMRLERHTH